jgi:spore coat protein CotH
MNRHRPISRPLRQLFVPAFVVATVALLAGCSATSEVGAIDVRSTAGTDTATLSADAPSSELPGTESTGTESTVTASTSAVGSSAMSTTVPVDHVPAEQASPTNVGVGVTDLGAVGTLDSATTHSISLEFDNAEFDAMISAYTTTAEKEWIEATVTIDGVTYEQAGVRLKGNSSLRSITGGGPPGMEDATTDATTETADAASPETLPWLIKLDKFVDGQSHEGLTELVVRSNSSSTSLNEAVALELLDLAGLASQDAIAAGFSVNGSDPVLRLVIDNPDDEWMAEELDATGALYKAEASGDYSYRGDDPEAYTEVFDQEAGKDNTDLTPLIEFLDFINNSDDETFETELADRLDVDRFATYLAMQDLLGNFDDIDGPGNNSYLYYDTATEQFTVVPWDYNLAFGQMPGGVGEGRMGGGQPPTGGERPTPPADLDRSEMPGGIPPGDFTVGDVPGVGGGMMGGSNILVERFLAVDEWNELYQTRLGELQVSLIDSGLASNILAAWEKIVGATGLVDETTVTDEAVRISSRFS